MEVSIGRKGSIQVDFVEPAYATTIWYHHGISNQGVYPPCFSFINTKVKEAVLVEFGIDIQRISPVYKIAFVLSSIKNMTAPAQ